MTEPSEPNPTVEADVACIQCGYNLRTLSSFGLCPECGRSIRESRLTRPDVHAFRRFGRWQVLYSLASSGCAVASFIARSNLPHTSNGADPVKVALQEFLFRCSVLSLTLLAAGVLWLILSKYPRQSKLIWAMIALDVVTTMFATVSTV